MVYTLCTLRHDARRFGEVDCGVEVTQDHQIFLHASSSRTCPLRSLNLADVPSQDLAQYGLSNVDVSHGEYCKGGTQRTFRSKFISILWLVAIRQRGKERSREHEQGP
jgi:hypothetical protein